MLFVSNLIADILKGFPYTFCNCITMLKKKPSSENPKENNEYFEQRFNCMVCMEPKLDMVYGQCQHKLCTDCLYVHNILRSNMVKCPICGKVDSFPLMLPDIPEDNREAQRRLGIRECPNKESGCKTTMWEWEQEDHVSTCQFVKKVCWPQVVNKPKRQKVNAGARKLRGGTVLPTARRSVRLMKKKKI